MFKILENRKENANMQPSGGGVQPSSPMPQGGSPWNSSAYSARGYFVYEADLSSVQASLAPGGAAQLTFNIAGDSDFFWTKFTVYALTGSPGAATTVSTDNLPGVTMLLINTTTGRQYSSAAVPLPNMAGNGRFPFILPQITLWQKKSTIQIQLSNISNATYTTLALSFQGIKAFTQSPPAQ